MTKYRSLFLFFLLLSVASAVYPINSDVVFGERPFIDIYLVADEAMEQGWIHIKFNSEHTDHLDRMELVKDEEGNVLFGLEEIDDLNRKYNVHSVSKLFDSPALENEFEWRHRQWGFHLWYEIHFDTSADIRDIVMAYRGLKNIVNWAEPEYKKELTGTRVNRGRDQGSERWTPNDTMLGTQWHYNNTGQQSGTPDADISLFDAWDIEKGHESVIVAIVDDGIQFNHPDLAANMWQNASGHYGYNFVSSSSTIAPGDHGTHVAGTVAAVTNNNTGVAGVAGGSGTGDGVRLMSCQVFTSSSSGGFHLAPVYAADNNAAISQNSWSYTSAGVYDQNVLDAIDYFNANGGGSVLDGGITIFAASNNDTNQNWYPAYYSGSFSVAATNNNDVKSYYSSYGTWVDISAPGGETHQVTARGVRSTVTGSSYAYYQGTSMACPHTSGVAGLLISYAYRNSLILDNSEVADLLRNTTDDHYALNPSYTGQLGTGRLNAHAALLELQDLLTGVQNPQNLTASTSGTSQINLSWTRNADNNSVMLAWSPSGDFGTPLEGAVYNVGNSLPGGGTVLYRGNNTTYNHTNLQQATTYHYKAFSYNAANQYSSGAITQGTTDYDAFGLPLNEDFNASATLPDFWEIADHQGNGQVWQFGTVSNGLTGTTGNYAYLDSDGYGSSSSQNADLITPRLDLSQYTSVNVAFTHYFRQYQSVSTATFFYSVNDGDTWTSIQSWDSTTSNPTTFDQDITAVIGQSQVKFKWNYTGSWGYYWCVDDIAITGTTSDNLSPGDLTASPGSGFVNLTWSAPLVGDPDGYNLYRDGVQVQSSLQGNSYLDNNVVNGTTYQYYVTAIYGLEESDPSNSVSATPSAVQTIDIGSGTNVNSTSTAAPLNIYYRSLRGQTVYTASEINAAGYNGEGLITHIGFYVTQSPIYGLPDFLVRMKHTTASDASAHDEGPYQTAYTNSSYAPTSGGWDMLELTTPFEWNGTDNILVDTAFDRVSAWNSSGQQRIFDSPSGFRYTWSDNSNQTNVNTTTPTNYKPQVRMIIEVPVPPVLNPPVNLSAAADINVVDLSWDAPAPTGSRRGSRNTRLNETRNTRDLLGYNVYRDGDMINSSLVLETQFEDDSVVSGTLYTYYVTAVYDEGESEPSSSVEVTTLMDTVASPVFDPEEQDIPFGEEFLLTISTATDGATIWHKTDEFAEWTEGNTLEIVENTDVWAKAAKVGWNDSEIGFASYDLKVSAPVITPAEQGEYFEEPIYITMETSTAGASIFYRHLARGRIDSNSGLTRTWTEYSEPIHLYYNEEIYLEVKAVKQGWLESDLVGALYSVSPGQAEIVISETEQTYSGEALGVEVSTNPSNLEYIVTYNDSADLPVNAGNYTVLVTITDDNYVGTETAALIINPLGITVTADAQSKVFGEQDPDFTYLVEPELVTGDTFTGQLSRDEGENVGDYEIFQGTLTAGDNYQMTYESDFLTITPASAAILIDNLSQTYGTVEDVTITTAPEDLAYTVTYNDSEELPVNAGNYTVLVTITDDNYVGAETAALIINPLGITVTADAQSKVFGEQDPEFTYITVPQLVAGDLFTGQLSRDEGENVGDYEIFAGTLTAGDNYQMSYESEFLTIVAAEAVVVVSASDITEGEPLNVTVTTVPEDLAYYLEYYFSSDLTAPLPEPPQEPGLYTVVAQIDEINHYGEGADEFSIEEEPEPIVLDPPDNLHISIDNGYLTISWDAVLNAEYYIVEATENIGTIPFTAVSERGVFSTDIDREIWTTEIDPEESHLFFRVKAAVSP